MSRLVRRILLAVLVLCGTFFAPERCSGPFCPEIFRVSPVLADVTPSIEGTESVSGSISLQDIEGYHGGPFVILNNNVPDFGLQELTTVP